MAIGRPIGQTRFITPIIVTTEAAWQSARPRGGERRDFRGTIPPTEEQIERAADYESHRVARAGAARAASRRVISTEEVHTRAIAKAAQAHSGQIDTETTIAQLAALQALVDAQALTIARLQARVDIIDGNSCIGEQA